MRAIRVGLIFLILVLAVAIAPWARAPVSAVLLAPHFFPGDVPRPLRLLPAPQVTTVEVPGAPGRMVADIYRPPGGPHPAMILLLGVDPLPRDHPQVATLADGIARLGIVTAVAESDALLAGEIREEEVDNLVALFHLLERDPGVDPRRVGFSGFCVGAVLQLLAAADARIADRVAYINAFSVYADALDVMRAVLSETMPTPEGSAPWTPHPTARVVFLRHLIGALPAQSDRELLEREFLRGEPLDRSEAATLSPLGGRVRELLAARDPERIASLMGALPTELTARFGRLSPGPVVGRLKARTFLMHDQNDTLLPVSGARQLAALVPPETRPIYSEFRLFAHVVPGGIGDPPLFAQELVRLVGHVSAVLRVIQS